MISIIVAMGANRVIGKDNKIPWRLPADMAYFKKTTTGHTVVMGRKTFESIGKPLPERRNIVLTHTRDFQAQGCQVVHSLEDILKLAEANLQEEIFIIGGDTVYSLFFPYSDRLYVTLIEHHFDGDTFFPVIDSMQWNLVSKIKGMTDEQNIFEHHFLLFEKIY